MSAKKVQPAPRGKANLKRSRPRPGILRRLWRIVLDHPRGVLIGAATLLGLIVVLENWRSTEAKLLIWTIPLPFIVWALIFMLVGYFTGKWIEWAIRQRRIRKGTYKPRRSAEELADASADLEGRLEPGAPADGVEEPATIIDRGEHRPPASKDGPVEKVDYWEEPGDAPTGGERPPDKFSPAARGAAGEAPRGREGSGERSGYREVRDYSDGAGRYSDYTDSGTGRYGDYADYHDGGGRYGDYTDSGTGRYGDYADYQDSGGRRGGRRR